MAPFPVCHQADIILLCLVVAVVFSASSGNKFTNQFCFSLHFVTEGRYDVINGHILVMNCILTLFYPVSDICMVL